MKRWIKRTLIGAFGATLLIGGLSACGHGHHGGWQMSEADATKMRDKVLDRAGRELKLDDAQKQRLATLADTLKAQRTALLGTATGPRAEAQALIAGAKFDRERAQAFVETKTTAIFTMLLPINTEANNRFVAISGVGCSSRRITFFD